MAKQPPKFSMGALTNQPAEAIHEIGWLKGFHLPESAIQVRQQPMIRLVGKHDKIVFHARLY
jgi:hypothetical protein